LFIPKCKPWKISLPSYEELIQMFPKTVLLEPSKLIVSSQEPFFPSLPPINYSKTVSPCKPKSIRKLLTTHSSQPIPCIMFHLPSFPPIEPIRDEHNHQPSRAFIPQTTIDHTGRRLALSPTEEVLNWQST
jgi:hypothetical protein